MRKISILSILLATSLYAAPPPIVYEIEADFQQTQSLPAQAFQQGAGVSLRYKLTSSGGYLDLAGLTGKWQGRSSATSTNYITQATATTVTSTTPDYIQFDLDYTATGTAVTNWVYSVIITSGSNEYVMGEGELDIKASAWTGSGHTITNNSYVAKLIAGTGITLLPTNGIGVVTITATASACDVTSVAGRTGDVVITSADLADFQSAVSTNPLVSGALQTESDPIWAAVSNTVTSGSALGATAVQPADSTYTATVAKASSAVQPAGLAGYAQLAGNQTFTGTNKYSNAGSFQSDYIYDTADRQAIDVYGRYLYGANGEAVMHFNSEIIGESPVLMTNGGFWRVQGTATSALQVVNYQTMTGMGFLTTVPANDSITTNLVNAVTVPTQVAGTSNSVIANTAFVADALAGFSGGTFTNLFAGSGTTGSVTSAAGDAGKYLKADGTWATVSAGGGGSVTNARQYIYLNPSMEFADRPDAVTTNSALTSRTMYAGAFDKDSTEYSDMLWFVTEPNWSGNINIAGDWWTDGTTNLTATWACKVYPRTGLGALGIVTGSTETIQAGIAMTNRQSINATIALSGLVATNSGGFGLRFGWLATNAVPNTRTSTIYQEFVSGAVVY